MNEVYTIIRELSGRSKTNAAETVNKQNGQPSTDRADLLREWAIYFEELLKSQRTDLENTDIPPAEEDLEISKNDFIMKEVTAAIYSCKSNKSPGVDRSVTAEALRYGGHSVKRELLKIYNAALNRGEVPKQWRENIIIPIPKKSSKRMRDFRGISLMSVSGKVYNRMLLNRIYNPVNNVLRPFQAGFRKGGNCVEQMHVLKRILEAYHQRQLPLIAAFIDFAKAFDSIVREQMWKILRHYGISENIVDGIATHVSFTKTVLVA